MKKSYLFLVLVTSLVLLDFFLKKTFKMDELLYESLAKQFTINQLESIYALNKNWSWLTYLLSPFLIGFKILLVSSILYAGFFFYERKIEFGQLLYISIKCEFLFVLIPVIKFCWFYNIANYTFEDIQYFYPLSALYFIGHKGLDPWWIYPFQTLNLFELAYWFILAYFLGKELKISMDKSFKVVASSYVPMLFSWVILIMFLTINNS